MKRLFKHFTLVSCALLVVALGGCDLTELNDNPNQPATATTPNLLTNAQIDLANVYWNDYPGGFWIRYAQYWTTNQYTDADRYGFPSRRPGANNQNWENLYLALNDLQEIIRINRQSPDAAGAYGPNDNQMAIAKIMQAWTFQMMTDIWGPIPYNNALSGRTEGNFTPEYTPQSEIYAALIDSLTTASEMIDPNEPALTSGDLVYNGDMSKWKKFANSVKMRVAMRMSDRRPQEAAAAINEAMTAGAFESNADNALIPFSNQPPYQNPFYENYEVEGRDDWTIPQSILGVMNDTEDPRRSAYFTDAMPDEAGEQFVGFPYGLPGGEAQQLFTSEAFSRPGLRVREAGAPAFLMLHDEVLFILAEAAERGYITGNPAQYYEDAIAASLNYWGVTDASAVDAYISRVPYSNSNDWAPEGQGPVWEQTLGIQRWLAEYLQGVQGWSTWRRLDFEGVLQVPPDNPGQTLFGCDIPLRMQYPNDESTLNQQNLQAAINNLLSGDGASEDTQGIPLWWDVTTPVCN